MPVLTAAIDPITRIEGHLKIDVDIDTVHGAQQVVDAHAVGTLFRGFERILEGRDPRDAPIITSRICGVCPTSHAHCASLALDDAFGAVPTDNARILRNLVDGACFLESHILHFFMLSLPDFITGPNKGPWQPGWDTGKRFDRNTSTFLGDAYLQALAARRKAHEMGSIFGGKLPHTPAYVGGGFTAVAQSSEITAFGSILGELIEFLRAVQLPAVERVAALYDEYFSIGTGYRNLLSYGAFALNSAGADRLFRPGTLQNGATATTVDFPGITESVRHSWYSAQDEGKHPSAGGTTAQHPKVGAYSWLKAPRYHGQPCECGPLARMWANNEYRHGISVMDRHRARAREAIKIAQAMAGWLTELTPSSSSYAGVVLPTTATGVGLTEAPRGALGHWISIGEGKITNYQVITPTCWNSSPRDSNGLRGPLEEALVGTPVANADEPIEVLRVLHSFDPCMDCATHAIRVNGRRTRP